MKAADVAVLVMGLARAQEHEATQPWRTPGGHPPPSRAGERNFSAAVFEMALETATPVIVILCNGERAAVSIDALISPAS